MMHDKLIAELTETLAVRDRQISDMNIELTSLRAKLEKAEEDTKRIDNLEKVVKNSCFEKVSLQNNGSGHVTITRRGVARIKMKALHHGPYYDLREALAALKEGK